MAGSGIRVPGLSRGENIAYDSPGASQPSEDDRRLRLDRDKTRHRPSALGNHDLFALALDLIEKAQALRLENTGSNFLLHDYDHITIVITLLFQARHRNRERHGIDFSLALELHPDAVDRFAREEKVELDLLFSGC